MAPDTTEPLTVEEKLTDATQRVMGARQELAKMDIELSDLLVRLQELVES